CLASCILDVACRCHQNFDDLCLCLFVVFEALACRLAQVRDRGVHDLWQALAVAVETKRPPHLGGAAAERREPIHNGFDKIAIGLEISLALGGDFIELFRAFALAGKVAGLLQEGEGRVHDAGARAIDTAGLFLDHLDDLVTVARLFCDEGKNDKFQIALCEHPADAESVVVAKATRSAVPPASPADPAMTMAVPPRSPVAAATFAVTSHAKHDFLPYLL